MVNFLISTAMVLSAIVLMVGVLGALVMIGRMFAGVARRLTRREPTAEEREIARLLADTDPNRR